MNGNKALEMKRELRVSEEQNKELASLLEAAQNENEQKTIMIKQLQTQVKKDLYN